jgi:hypothetical protein
MKKIQIQVPEPCHENWLLMTPSEKGRYCNSCQKVVVDFSIMSDAEIMRYFQKNTGSTCGNFTVGQLSREIREPATPVRKKYWGMLFSVLVTFFASCKSSVEKVRGKIIPMNSQRYEAYPMIVGAIVMMPEIDTATIPKISTHLIDEIESTRGEVEMVVSEPTIQSDISIRIVDSVEPTIIVTGKVMNDQGAPLPGAVIHIQELDKRIVTNAEGTYSVSLEQHGKLTFITSYVGYNINETYIEAANEKARNIVLTPSENELAGVVVVGYGATRGRTIVAGAVSIIRKQSIVEQIIDTVKCFLPSSISIFPNPASKGGIVKIELNFVSDFDLFLIDNNGRNILRDQFSLSSKNQIHSFQVPSTIAAGVYYVRVMDRNSKRQYSSKLIVQ